VKLVRMVGAGVLASMLAACATTGGGRGGNGDDSVAVQAISQQTPKNDIEKRAKDHTELGNLYAQDGRYSVALDEVRLALSADDSYAPAYNLKAIVHMALGENGLADESFRRALSLAPRDPEINNNYGWFLCQSGKEADSIERFRIAYRNPLYLTPTRAYTNAGICYLRMKNYTAAEQHLTTAIRYDSGNTLALYWLAETYYQSNRLVEARQRVNDLSRVIDPTVEVVWLGLRIEHKLGDRDAELRYSTTMRRKFADTPQYQKMVQGQFE